MPIGAAVVRGDAIGPVERRLALAHRRLADGGLALAIGVTTVVAGLDQIPTLIARRSSRAGRCGGPPA